MTLPSVLLYCLIFLRVALLTKGYIAIAAWNI